MIEYFVPTASGETEFTEKRSRFLGHVRRAESEDEAREFIAQMKKKYFDARHNCWCYIIRGGAERYSDDGEPQGTAGLPMLELMRRERAANVVCVVTRYFGGVLLGTGGLMRAYTKSAKDALAEARLAAVASWTELELQCSYALLEKLKSELSAAGGLIEALDYAENVTIKAAVPSETAEKLCARVFDLSAGTVRAKRTGESRRAVIGE